MEKSKATAEYVTHALGNAVGASREFLRLSAWFDTHRTRVARLALRAVNGSRETTEKEQQQEQDRDNATAEAVFGQARALPDAAKLAPMSQKQIVAWVKEVGGEWLSARWVAGETWLASGTTLLRVPGTTPFEPVSVRAATFLRNGGHLPAESEKNAPREHYFDTIHMVAKILGGVYGDGDTIDLSAANIGTLREYSADKDNRYGLNMIALWRTPPAVTPFGIPHAALYPSYAVSTDGNRAVLINAPGLLPPVKPLVIAGPVADTGKPIRVWDWNPQGSWTRFSAAGNVMAMPDVQVPDVWQVLPNSAKYPPIPVPLAVFAAFKASRPRGRVEDNRRGSIGSIFGYDPAGGRIVVRWLPAGIDSTDMVSAPPELLPWPVPVLEGLSGIAINAVYALAAFNALEAVAHTGLTVSMYVSGGLSPVGLIARNAQGRVVQVHILMPTRTDEDGGTQYVRKLADIAEAGDTGETAGETWTVPGVPPLAALTTGKNAAAIVRKIAKKSDHVGLWAVNGETWITNKYGPKTTILLPASTAKATLVGRIRLSFQPASGAYNVATLTTILSGAGASPPTRVPPVGEAIDVTPVTEETLRDLYAGPYAVIPGPLTTKGEPLAGVIGVAATENNRSGFLVGAYWLPSDAIPLPLDAQYAGWLVAVDGSLLSAVPTGKPPASLPAARDPGTGVEYASGIPAEIIASPGPWGLNATGASLGGHYLGYGMRFPMVAVARAFPPGSAQPIQINAKALYTALAAVKPSRPSDAIVDIAPDRPPLVRDVESWVAGYPTGAAVIPTEFRSAFDLDNLKLALSTMIQRPETVVWMLPRVAGGVSMLVQYDAHGNVLIATLLPVIDQSKTKLPPL